MVSYFELNKSKLLVQDKGPMLLSEDQRAEVGTMWDDIKLRNPNAFNGGVWTCLGYTVKGTEVTIDGAQTNYATATCARRHNWPVGSTMGTGIFVFDENNNVVFAERTQKVVSDKGKISMAAGGVLDTNTPVIRGNFLGMVLEQMGNELREELTVRGSSKIELVGVAIGPGKKVEWSGAVRVEKPRIRDADEAVKLTRIPRRNLSEYVDDNITKFELSTLWHLLHWKEKIAKSDRFDFLK